MKLDVVQMTVRVDIEFGWRWYLDKVIVAALMVLVLTSFSLCASCSATAGGFEGHASPPEDPSAIDWRTPAEQRAAAVVIYESCPDGIKEHRASGVVLGPYDVLTAAHVVDNTAHCTYSVETLRGRKYEVHLVAELIVSDVARLQSDSALDGASPVTIGPTPLLEAELCIATAWPKRTHACGTVDAYRLGAGDTGVGVVVEPGNSGSGVYDAMGRLVGVVTHLRRDTGNGWLTSLADHTGDLL
jgi:S1-C subfamily serine protease